MFPPEMPHHQAVRDASPERTVPLLDAPDSSPTLPFTSVPLIRTASLPPPHMPVCESYASHSPYVMNFVLDDRGSLLVNWCSSCYHVVIWSLFHLPGAHGLSCRAPAPPIDAIHDARAAWLRSAAASQYTERFSAALPLAVDALYVKSCLLSLLHCSLNECYHALRSAAVTDCAGSNNSSCF